MAVCLIVFSVDRYDIDFYQSEDEMPETNDCRSEAGASTNQPGQSAGTPITLHTPFSLGRAALTSVQAIAYVKDAHGNTFCTVHRSNLAPAVNAANALIAAVNRDALHQAREAEAALIHLQARTGSLRITEVAL